MNFPICDEVLKTLKIEDDPQAVMTSAEVMTFCILSAILHTGNHKLTLTKVWVAIRV